MCLYGNVFIAKHSGVWLHWQHRRGIEWRFLNGGRASCDR